MSRFKSEVVILAAGKGTRMRSTLPKVLHPILGWPMLRYVLEAAKQVAVDVPVVVVGHGGTAVEAAFAGQARFVRQEPQLGTADAVAKGLQALPADGTALILYGDMPLLRGEALEALVSRFHAESLDALVLAATFEDPTGYGRVLQGADGRLERIVEERDATPEERRVRLVNTGVSLTRIALLRDVLGRVPDENAQRERYLPDAFTLLAREGYRVAVVQAEDATDYWGVNDRLQLATATTILRHRILRHWMAVGVTVEDPDTTYIGPEVRLGQDVVLRPGTYLLGRTEVGDRSVVGPMTRLLDSRVGEESEVVASFVEQSTIGDRVRVGPFAHIRPGCTIEEGAEVGNYAELKNVRFGAYAKAHHHSYLGDADIGARVNIGAGAITVNYDGRAKHRTVVQPGGFIGCNANLIAPVTIGEGAYVAAGSTVDEDVPARSLAIARERQRNILGWVERRRSRRSGEDEPT